MSINASIIIDSVIAYNSEPWLFLGKRLRRTGQVVYYGKQKTKKKTFTWTWKKQKKRKVLLLTPANDALLSPLNAGNVTRANEITKWSVWYRRVNPICCKHCVPLSAPNSDLFSSETSVDHLRYARPCCRGWCYCSLASTPWLHLRKIREGTPQGLLFFRGMRVLFLFIQMFLMLRN